MNDFDHHLWRRFKGIALPYWPQEEKWQARWLLGLLILLLLGQTGEFTSALAARDADRFWRAIRQSFVILIVAVPIYALSFYIHDKLDLYWRRWLTGHFLGSYFTNRAYYELNGSAEIDNPD